MAKDINFQTFANIALKLLYEITMKLCKINNTEDINVTFHKGKKYQFQKIIPITSQRNHTK